MINCEYKGRDGAAMRLCEYCNQLIKGVKVDKAAAVAHRNCYLAHGEKGWRGDTRGVKLVLVKDAQGKGND